MTVADIQRALIARGYDLGKGGPSGKGDDGLAGDRTEAAIRAFQAAEGLPPTGTADAPTQGLLAVAGDILLAPAPTVMQLSAIGEAVLIAREGRRLKAYRDSVGVWTIGVGHTSAAGPPVVRPGLSIGVEECDRIFSRDAARFVRSVREALPAAEPLPQHAFDALVSLCFNIGPSAFLRSSVLRRLRAGDRHGAAEAILMWDRPAEIIPRRQGEYDQFRTPYERALPRARRGDARAVARPKRRAGKPAGGPANPPALPEPLPAPVRTGWLARLRARLWPR